MQLVSIEAPPEPAESPAWPPAMTPERARYVQQAVLSIAAAVVDSMLGDLLHADPSTEASSSLADRTMVRLMRPYLPRMRGLFLGKLAETDPAALEKLMGAVAVTIEQILAEAPGEPMERWRFVWAEGATSPELVEDVWRG
jgi:hypothetical protein